MGELRIRRERALAAPAFRSTAKTEKQAGSAPVRQAGAKAVVSVSDTLRQVIQQVGQAKGGLQQARRTLQTGEAVLAEVQDGLGGLEDLARKAAGGQAGDSLQAEADRLCGEIERILEAGPFSDGDGLLEAVKDSLSSQEGLQGLPAWLLGGMADMAPDKEALLAALGLDSSASGADLVAALGRLPPEDSAAAGYLAALYLGAVIAGGGNPDRLDPALAADGLRQLLETVAEGTSPDEAIALLTGGRFTSLADFQEQFSGGTAPGLEGFLTGLLLNGESQAAVPFLPALLGGGDGGGFDLLMGLLAALESSMAGAEALPDAAEAEAGALGQAMDGGGDAAQAQAREWPGVRAAGSDLSQAAFDPETGVLTLAGDGDTALRGQGTGAPPLWLAGTGTVRLQQVDSPMATVDAAQAGILSEGENTLAQVRLGNGTALTLEGPGVLRIGLLRGGEGSSLRLAGGTTIIEETAGTAVPVVVDGPASLLAAKGLAVRDPQGESLSPFDILWKTLLPDWNSIQSMEVDGRQGAMDLTRGIRQEAVRLWLLKGNESQGFPAHSILLQGRDQAGRLRTRYVYLRWSRQAGAFEALPLYPNPFTVTGGRQDADWRYDEENGSLHILTDRVAAIAGGTGEDANQLPFSGRMALADGIGPVELTLEGVECRVSSGRAFSLGRGNRVTLLLQSGSHNIFESGAGCAGISLGEGTSLRIDQAKGGRGGPGTLSAAGGSGSAGIGRDSGVGQQLTGPILICGGSVTATGGKAGVSASLIPKPPAPANAAAEAAAALPRFRLSAQSLQLDALDLSTRETARAAVEVLAHDRRQVARMQRAYSAMYGRLEQSLGGLQSVRQYIGGGLRDSDEAGALLWDMRESLGNSSVAAYSQWLMEDIEQLLR